MHYHWTNGKQYVSGSNKYSFDFKVMDGLIIPNYDSPFIREYPTYSKEVIPIEFDLSYSFPQPMNDYLLLDLLGIE